jgi:glycosyltransferase 2 family protein
MLEVIRRAISFLRHKQVLHKLGVAISLAVIATACYVLFHILRHIDVDQVLDAIKDTEAHQIALAALFVAAGYFTLTFYDLFAVRAIGRNDLPYRVNALAAFTSYSIGHNVGASVFTGGAVRYRIYSAWGLNAIDVAKICFLAGLTFWLGNAAVLGLGIAYHPEAASAIDQLPPWLNRIVAIVIIVGLAAYVGWVSMKPRGVGRGPWTVVLPSGPLTILQIAIGILDLSFCALAMYVLVPDEPNLGSSSSRSFSSRRHCLASPAILREDLAYSTRPCSSVSGRWIGKSCWQECCCFACCIIFRRSSYL